MEILEAQLLEDNEQLKSMIATPLEFREKLYGILCSNETLQDCMNNNLHRINEIRQLLVVAIIYEGELPYEDCMEILERFDYVKKDIKHSCRLDSNLPTKVY